MAFPPSAVASPIADQLSASHASLALNEATWLLGRLDQRFAAIAWTPAGLADLDEHLDELEARLAHLRTLAATRRASL